LQQQTSASAKAQDVQSLGADAPQLAVTKAQPKRKTPTSTKTQPKRQKATPSSPPQPAPQSRAEPADAPEQTIDPSDQGTSSAIVPKQTTIAPTQGIILIIHEVTTDELCKEIIIILGTQPIL